MSNTDPKPATPKVAERVKPDAAADTGAMADAKPGATSGADQSSDTTRADGSPRLTREERLEARQKRQNKRDADAKSDATKAKTTKGKAAKGKAENTGPKAGRKAKAAGKAQPQKQAAGPKKNEPLQVVEVAPMASRARLRSRHWGIFFSFVFHLILPLVVAGWYLWERAEDRFASTVGFTVQQEQLTSLASPLTDAFSALGSSGSSPDADILYEYLQSQKLVEAIDAEFDLRGHYAQFHDADPIFSLNPDATLEDLVAYWPKILRIAYDEGSGLIELQVLAYDALTAQAIAGAVVTNSQALINDLNAQSRADTMRYAQEDLAAAEAQLSQARKDLVAFRTRTQIVDPETDLAGRLGIVNTLQEQLAEALVEFDLLAQSTSDGDPRVIQAQRRIDVIRARVAQERANVARGQENDTGEDYPTLLAEYEGLVVRREISEQSYRVALTSVEAARADAARQSRYLAAYITPTLPQTATYPQRLTLMGLITLFGLLAWTIAVLIYYSVRDSR